MSSTNQASARLATRLSFLVAGFGMACWAPLVPYAKHRLLVDDGVLGMLLLCLGVGSVLAMLITAPLSARHGNRPIIVAAGLGMALILPLLTLAQTPMTLGLGLLGFGAALGSLDVAMNVHAIEVERVAQRPLMSGFHALFSVGGFAGSSLMTLLLSIQVSALICTALCSAMMVAAMRVAWPRLLSAKPAVEGPLLVMPRGIVLLLAGLAAITFLIEGALLDWSALLMTEAGVVTVAQGGLGYMLFSVAMTVGRLGGDALTARIGGRATLFWGGWLAVAGFALVLATTVMWIAMLGFLLIGLGASNLVPVLFRQAGAQRVMPVSLAVAAITTTGYAGILMGPAGVGFVAKVWSLPTAFWLLVGLFCLVPLGARRVMTITP